MYKWVEGNIPDNKGTYWVTVKNSCGKGDPNTVFPSPLIYSNGEWTVPFGGSFFKERIIAHRYCPVPEPYDPKKIGDADSFYIKVSRPGSISYYSKGLQSINWSKIGYATTEKAVLAMKRLKKLELEETPDEASSCIYEVIDGDGNPVA